jgi:phosphatidate cytidylyltransferase
MTRILSGAILLAIAIGVVVFASALMFTVVAEALVVLGCIEYAALARASRIDMPAAASTLAAAIMCLAVGEDDRIMLEIALVVSFVALAVATLARWRGEQDAVARAAAAAFPSLYLGVPIGAMVLVRGLYGWRTLFLMMLTVFVSDTAQYYSGRSFGRTPLAPAISPKKTVEGAAGGFVCGALVTAVVGAWWLPATHPAVRALLGAAIVAFGIAGDLFESMLKRSAGVKDSSSLIPGHGGVLDRIDALLFAAPVYYLALMVA